MSCRAASLIAAFFLIGLGRACAEEVISTTTCRVKGIRGKATIQIVMTKGAFHDDDTLWCGSGKKWEGEFEIRVRAGGKLLSRAALDGFTSFYAPKFKLVLRDYNGDGRIDFNLGQYGGCMYNHYSIFTIRRDGMISQLPWAGADEVGFVVSGAHHDNSTRDLTVRHGRVQCTYYDRSSNPFGYVTEQWAWKRDKFVVVATKPATSNEWPPKSWRLAN